MKRGLERVLRIRELLEELSRLEFENRSAALTSLEQAAAQQRQKSLLMRAEGLRALLAHEPAASELWWMPMADARIAGWTGERLEAMAEASRPAFDRAREEWMVRHRERLKMELLHAAAVRAGKNAQMRQEQNRIDDWYQSRPPQDGRRRR